MKTHTTHDGMGLARAGHTSRLVVAIMIGWLVTACSAAPTTQDTNVSLTGSQEVPPVTTQATASGSFVIASDRTVRGSITTANIAATMAHIHVGKTGQNGPIIVPLQKKGDNEWMVPPDTRLTEAQIASYKAGELYVNVHSAAYPGGEIRAQLMPPQPTMAEATTPAEAATPTPANVSLAGVDEQALPSPEAAAAEATAALLARL